jgi:hypothetical protein
MSGRLNLEYLCGSRWSRALTSVSIGYRPVGRPPLALPRLGVERFVE